MEPTRSSTARPSAEPLADPRHPQLIEDLLTPGVELVETHASWVLLGAEDVFKIKKPVDFGFLDFTTPRLRRAACEAEVSLNRRLAPDVYRGFLPVTRDRNGRHRIGGPGAPVDWAVHMVRLSDRARADRRLRDGRLSVAEIVRVAARVAAFHAAARSDAETARFGTPAAIRRNVDENFEQCRGFLASYLGADRAAEVEAWQLGFLRREADRFAARAAAGRVRDGHGDLRLEHIYLDARARVTVIDCIEFNDRFRYADVAADVAFLAMDLAWHGAASLAEVFLAAYAREADDYDLYPLIDFYESYRAFVRGKVAGLIAGSTATGAGARLCAAADARRYFLLALASGRRRLEPPRLIAVGGVIAAGKSTVAERIGVELAAPVISSDRTRKLAVLGLAPTAPAHDPPWQRAYAPEITDRVYDEVLRRAGAVLGSGRSVVLDASFRSRARRAAARRLAAGHGVPFRFVECRADPEICRHRLRARARQTGESDGRLAIFDDFLDRWHPVHELPAGEHRVFDSGREEADDFGTMIGWIESG